MQANRETGSAVAEGDLRLRRSAIGRAAERVREARQAVPVWLRARQTRSRIGSSSRASTRCSAATCASCCPAARRSSREIAEFFHAVGLPILEGYGLTETTPAPHREPPDALPLRHRRSAARLLRGPHRRPTARSWRAAPNVAPGYYERPEATAESVGRRRLVPHRRHRRDRRRRLPPHHRPEEGPDQDVGREVRRAAEDREPPEAPAAREPGRA